MSTSDYTLTVGLEIHAELKTATKMFCASKNDPHTSDANTHICPVCMAHPGTLPVINKEAVRSVLRVGAAVNGVLADYSEFDRKNYFYPDLPKGYQISQYKHPLVSGGALHNVQLTRIHLEEDTARSQHHNEWSLVDYNRAGVPLMELVTEPIIHDAKTASGFAQELQLLLRTLGVSGANMEKGEMRVEANISVSRDSSVFGTKVEVKNLNSFKSVEKAIEYEVKRQTEILEKGEKLIQETRGWDEQKQSTFSQRIKEDSKEYRYFPDPDIPKLKLSEYPEFSLENIVNSLPELPSQKRKRYLALGIKEEDVDTLIFNHDFGLFFDNEVLTKTSDAMLIKIAVNYLLSDVRGLGLSNLEKLEKGVFFELVEMIGKGDLSSRGAKDLLPYIAESGQSPRALAESKSLLQEHDVEALHLYVRDVLAEHKSVVGEYKAGKGAALQFLVGQVMKRSRGSANPKKITELLRAEIE